MDVLDARRRTVSRLRTAHGVAGKEAAFFSVLKLGTYVALSCVDDPDVRHEAASIVPLRSSLPMMITMWSSWLERKRHPCG